MVRTGSGSHEDDSFKAIRQRVLQRAAHSGEGEEHPKHPKPHQPPQPPPQQRRSQSARGCGASRASGASGSAEEERGRQWMADVGLDANRLPVSLSILAETIAPPGFGGEGRLLHLAAAKPGSQRGKRTAPAGRLVGLA